MEVKRVEAFGDSLPVVQQVCFNVLEDHLLHILASALISSHILLNSGFGIFQGMK
jgi:hypothetical protein